MSTREAACDPKRTVTSTRLSTTPPFEPEPDLTRISTQLDKETVLARLRELVEDTHRVWIFRSGLEGEVSGHRISVAYRTGWFVPPVQIAYFQGRVLSAETGTNVLGDVHFSWPVYLFAGLLGLGLLVALIASVGSGHFSDILPSLALAAVAFWIGKLFVSAAGRGIVDDICKAVRGSVEQEG